MTNELELNNELVCNDVDMFDAIFDNTPECIKVKLGWDLLKSCKSLNLDKMKTDELVSMLEEAEEIEDEFWKEEVLAEQEQEQETK